MKRRIALGFLLAGSLSACGTMAPQMREPTEPFYGPVPSMTATPADAALYCLAQSEDVQNDDTTYAVHLIQDATNKFATYETGGYLPRDVAGMMVTSLAKAGVHQVNRANTAVSEWEIERAREQVLGDGESLQIGNQVVTFRPLVKGALRGSDVVIDGALTQLDFNTYSGGGEVTVGGIGGGARIFALTAAADIRVTDTRSTEILMGRSYSKQAVGTEIFASIFRFFGSELFDVKIGDKSQEGLHAGVRWMLAEAAYDIVATISNHSGACDQYLPEVTRQLRADRTTGEVRTFPEPSRVNGLNLEESESDEASDDGASAADGDGDRNEDSAITAPRPAPVSPDASLGETVTVRLPDGRVIRSTLTQELLSRGHWNADRTVFIVTR